MNKTKFLVLISVFFFVLPTAAFASFTDVADTVYEEPVGVLHALAIINGYEDGTFLPEQEVTRAEFASIVVRTLGLEGISGEPALYSDMTAEHWAYGNVSLCTQLGIIRGMGDGRFVPDATVTYEQAVKMLVCVLGYEPKALQMGGYPSGYLSVAAQLGMLKGIHQDYGDYMSRGLVAKLVYQSLDIDLMEETIGSEQKYEIREDETLLSRYLGTEKKKGLVTANANTSILADKTVKLRSNELMIDETVYETTIAAPETLLGRQISYYLKTDNETETVIAAFVTAQNRETVITGEQITDVRTDSGAVTIEYDENGRSVSEPVPVDAAWIYNGKALPQNEKTAEAVDIREGEITLLENGSGAGTSAVFITEYENFVFDGKNESSSTVTIYDKYQKTLKYSAKDSDTTVVIRKNNESIGVSELELWDVLSVRQSRDGKLIQIDVAHEPVEGKLTSISRESEDCVEVEISGKAYQLAQNLLTQTRHEIGPGEEGTFYLDSYGRIAAMDTESAGAGSYGFLLDYAIDGGVAEGVTFRLLNDRNQIVKYKAADNIRFERESGSGVMLASTVKAAEAAHYFDRIPNTANSNTVDRQLVTYELNVNGELYKLNTAASVPDADKFSLSDTYASRAYNTSEFDEKYKVNSQTKVFYIPGYGERDDLNTSGSPYKYFNTGKLYTTALYDVDDSLTVGAVVIKSTIPEHIFATQISLANSPVMVVQNLGWKLDAEGSEAMFAEGYIDGEWTELMLSPELAQKGQTAKDFVCGNVIQLETNQQEIQQAQETEPQKQVILYEVLFKGDSEEKRTYDGYEIVMANCQLGTSVGTVSYRDETTLLLTFAGTEETPFIIDDSIHVYRVNRAKKELESIGIREIEKGQKLFIRQRYQRVKEIVLMEQ